MAYAQVGCLDATCSHEPGVLCSLRRSAKHMRNVRYTRGSVPKQAACQRDALGHVSSSTLCLRLLRSKLVCGQADRHAVNQPAGGGRRARYAFPRRTGSAGPHHKQLRGHVRTTAVPHVNQARAGARGECGCGQQSSECRTSRPDTARSACELDDGAAGNITRCCAPCGDSDGSARSCARLGLEALCGSYCRHVGFNPSCATHNSNASTSWSRSWQASACSYLLHHGRVLAIVDVMQPLKIPEPNQVFGRHDAPAHNIGHKRSVHVESVRGTVTHW